ncbi:DUF366 family protein [Desulfuribacillus stibiiarsenatis]|nr:DUF366 family protein [Desulfuribacillus stibiiarsenatis]
MKYLWHDERLTYDGTQLSSLFAYRNFSIQGNSIIGFQGPCHVSIEEMVDLADVKQNAHIYSLKMVHFIVEVFEMDLVKTVYIQRILVSLVKEILEKLSVQGVVRRGDDLYIADKKLSVSIATLSPVSTMIHFGINVSSEDTPVPTLGLNDLNIDAVVFGEMLLKEFSDEVESVNMARCKVRGVL